MALTGDEVYVNRPATLVFRTVHIDRAGKTSADHVVEAEVADVDAAGTALLVTRDGVHVRLPVRALYPVHPAGAPPGAQAFIGGQELTRDFHPRVGAARTSLRWLDRGEVEQVLAASGRSRGRGP
jgi:hypothetical protein